MLKVALRHFLKPSFLLLASVMARRRRRRSPGGEAPAPRPLPALARPRPLPVGTALSPQVRAAPASGCPRAECAGCWRGDRQANALGSRRSQQAWQLPHLQRQLPDPGRCAKRRCAHRRVSGGRRGEPNLLHACLREPRTPARCRHVCFLSRRRLPLSGGWWGLGTQGNGSDLASCF